MSLWTYFLNTMTASSFAEENEMVMAKTLLAEADKTRLAEAARPTPANLSFAAAALAEEGLWQDAIAMDDEADRLLVSKAKIPAWQRDFAAVAFAEAGEPGMAGAFLAGGTLPAAEDIQVQDRRLELFLQGYVRMAGAVAYAEAGEQEQALRLSSGCRGQILVIADGALLHNRMRDYAIRLAEKSGLELVVVNALNRQHGRKNGTPAGTGLQTLLDEARRCKIPCRHYAAGKNVNRTVDEICAELGGVAFVLTETARQAETAACTHIPVFTMAFLDEAIGQPTAA